MSTLEEQLDEFGAAALRVADERNEFKRRADAAEARVKVLEKELEPFAKEAERYEPDEGDDDQIAWASDFTIGLLRRARAALASKEDGK